MGTLISAVKCLDEAQGPGLENVQRGGGGLRKASTLTLHPSLERHKSVKADEVQPEDSKRNDCSNRLPAPDATRSPGCLEGFSHPLAAAKSKVQFAFNEPVRIDGAKGNLTLNHGLA